MKTNDLVTMVVAEEDAGRRMPFAFLAELMKRVSNDWNARSGLDTC